MVRAYSKPSWISAEVKVEAKKKKARKALLSQSSKKAISVVFVSICMVVASVLLSMIPNPPVVTTSAPKIKIVQGEKDLPRANPVKKSNHNQETTTLENTSEAENNEFYNPNVTASGETVHIIPYHIWYQNGKMYSDCYVVNINENMVFNIVIDELQISNENEIIGDANFGEIKGLTLEPGQYVTHRFIFQKGTFKKSDLTKGISYYARSRWENSNEIDDSENQYKQLEIFDDTVTYPTYANVLINNDSAMKDELNPPKQKAEQLATQESSAKEENQEEPTEQQPTTQLDS